MIEMRYMNTNHIQDVNEVDFCLNKCKYHNRKHGWCSYYSCKINEITQCELISYDIVGRQIIINKESLK